MPRLRLRYRSGDQPLLVLTDTPDPNCPDCHGDGGWAEDYGDYTGEYAGTHSYWCTCWNPDHPERALPLPRWVARLLFGWTEPVYSNEPPF
ncbi:hypothetical protein ACFV1L_14070 [Kitasatospora sp. NPDC059646]|uniref:hypothetical protein n=1 Tax=Kitasatospora sp. NPDC059646 TaxID=3346893 RepID=UPI0036A977D7